MNAQLPDRCEFSAGGHYRYGHWVKNGLSKTGKQKWTFRADTDEVRYPDNPPAERLKNSARYTGWYKRPSIFMPRWASRIQLEVTEVRVQRVQEICNNQSDAIAEGVLFMGGLIDYPDNAPWCASLKDQEPMKYPSAAFGRLWDKINAERGYGWYANPWCWAITFKRIA